MRDRKNHDEAQDRSIKIALPQAFLVPQCPCLPNKLNQNQYYSLRISKLFL